MYVKWLRHSHTLMPGDVAAAMQHFANALSHPHLQQLCIPLQSETLPNACGVSRTQQQHLSPRPSPCKTTSHCDPRHRKRAADSRLCQLVQPRHTASSPLQVPSAACEQLQHAAPMACWPKAAAPCTFLLPPPQCSFPASILTTLEPVHPPTPLPVNAGLPHQLIQYGHCHQPSLLLPLLLTHGQVPVPLLSLLQGTVEV
jgi:hypothetical protein